ncbi:hypothetical protein [Novosphingobium sp. BW1]|uniref:hypothetical protein n=1 Tax=Novosphingobium sp. BW1 TaxID=2592621 RepID=UPI0011DE9AC7|nr:hypothetical protein [Novosphingobium sp. BW1]TYC93028.1 hypothetical protein FMM79_03310 [Novosphingobium sp. BW1]
MSELGFANHLALFAIVNGLRKAGEVSEATILAIVEELEAATEISDAWGHGSTTEALNKLGAAIRRGRPSY